MKDGHTALMLACNGDHQDCVMLLLAAGASIDTQAKVRLSLMLICMVMILFSYINSR